MRKLFFLFSFPLCMLTVRAASGGVNAMLLQGPSDFRLTILLDDQPVVTFSDDYLVVFTHMGAAVSIPSSLVSKWTYVKDEDATDIGKIARFGSLLSFDGKHIGMSSLAPSTAVQVYTADGALVASATADSRGSVSLSVPEHQGAVYVVKTSSVTFKVSKP